MAISEYKKDFDGWNIVKQKLNNSNFLPPFFMEREVWWVSTGTNIGNEIDGKSESFVRPVLIIKKFNRYLFFGIPLSTKIKQSQYYLEIYFLNKYVSALLSQVRCFSSKRILNKMGKLDMETFTTIKENTLQKLLSPPLKQGSRA